MVTDTVIFDFDDTLVATNQLFEDARERFFGIMSNHGYTNRELINNYLEEADIRNVIASGYMAKHCFPQALRETYTHFTCQDGKCVDDKLAHDIEKIGWDIYEREAAYIDGAHEVLGFLKDKVNLYLFTQGDADMQAKRVHRSKLLDYFDDYRVAKKKDAAAYEKLMTDKQIIPHRSWMIGNSIKSDINPAIAVGLQAAHYKNPAWEFEQETPIGKFHSVERLIDFLELIDYDD